MLIWQQKYNIDHHSALDELHSIDKQQITPLIK